MQNPPTAAGPSQQGGGSQPGSSGKATEKTRSSQVRQKSTGSVRNGRGQSPVPRTSDRSRTPNKAQTPIRHRTPDREATPDRGKIHASQASPTSPPNCQMVEKFPPQGRPPPGIRGPLRAVKIRNTTPEATLPDPKCPKGEYSFQNTRFPNTTAGRSWGFGGGDCPFSKHEEDVHAIAEGVAGRRFIRRQRSRQPFDNLKCS